MSRRVQYLEPVLISDLGIGLVVHIKDYRSRQKIPIPLCRVDHWQDIDWAVDTSNGHGAKPCGRCERVWDKLRTEAIRKQSLQDKLKNAQARSTPLGREANRVRVLTYREANRRVYNKKKLIRYWADPEAARAKKREYYARNRERIKAQQKGYRDKQRAEEQGN